MNFVLLPAPAVVVSIVDASWLRNYHFGPKRSWWNVTIDATRIVVAAVLNIRDIPIDDSADISHTFVNYYDDHNDGPTIVSLVRSKTLRRTSRWTL